MKKVSFLFALCAMLMSSLTVSAKQYCHEALTSGDNTIYLSAQMLSEGNYQIKIEADVNMNGLGGSFCYVNGAAGYQLNAADHFVLSEDKQTITIDIASTSAPNLYTPLYVLMPGEVNFAWPGDIEWGICDEANYVPAGTFVAPEDWGHLISFSAVAAQGSLDQAVFESNGLKIQVIDTDSSKLSIDANTAYFGEVKNAFPFGYRLKTAGKSSAKNVLKGTAPEDGTLLIYVRTGSNSDTTRNVIVSQNSTELFNQIVRESLAKKALKPKEGGNDTVKIYPVFEVEMKAGAFEITYPKNAVNFYAFDFKATPKEAPEAAAPAPEVEATKVISFYSDTYTPGTGVEFSTQDWGSGSAFTGMTIADNNLIKVNANNYFGIHLLADVDNSSLDVSAMEYMHLDVWAAEDMSFNFGPVWVGGEKVNPVIIKGQKWNQIDVPFADYTGFDPKTIRQLKFDGFGGAKTIYIDNIYTYTTKEPVAAADRRIYAYGLDVAKDGDNYTFTYKANIDGAEANIVFFKDGVEAGKVAVAAPMKGTNTVVVPASEIPAGEMTWGVELKAGAVTEFAELFSGPNLMKCHLAIDNSPESDYFGRLYIANRAGSASGGIYVYDQEFNLIADNTLAGVPKWQSMGRPAVGADGTVYLADWGDVHGGIYVMDPSTLLADTFFVGTQASSGLWTNAEGVAMGSSTASVGVFGEGANTVLYAMNEDVPEDNSLYQHGVNVYHIGQPDGTILKKWDKAPTLAFPLQDNAAQMFVINANEHGAFFSSSRSKGNNAAGARSLQFYNVRGERTFVALPEGETADLTGSLGGGCAVSKDLSELAIVDGDGNILLYSVAWTDDIPALTFVKKYETPFAALGTLVFDYAGNIMVTGGANYNNSTANHLVVYSVPTNDNSVVVPAKKALVVIGTKVNTHITEPDKAAPEPTWPANQVKAMYSAKYNADFNFADWGSGTVYTQDTYGKKFVTTNLGYFGTEGFELNCLNMEYLHYDFWVAEDASIRIVPIWGGAEQGIYVSLKGQQWNQIDIPLTDYTGVTNWGRIWQVKIDEARELTLWMDNAYFYRTTELIDDEVPTNVSASMDAAYYFTASLKMKATDNSGAVNFTVYDGETEMGKTAAGSEKDAYLTINNLKASTEYTLTVVASDDNGNKAEAVSVTVKTLDAPAPAPAPEMAADDVISIYSDAYEAATWFNLGGWGQSTVITRGEIAEGDEVFYLYNANYMGWELNNNVAAFDATGFTGVHMDIYPEEGTSIGFTPIWGSEAATSKPLEAGKWNSVDFEFSLYNGINPANIYQLKWDWMPAKMFLDNVYIYKKTSDAVDDLKVEDKAQKIMRDGVIYIIRDGKTYNLMGVQVR